MSTPKLCKDCRHFMEPLANLCGVAPPKCRRTDLVGGGWGVEKCADERSSRDSYACGPDGKHWEPAA